MTGRSPLPPLLLIAAIVAAPPPAAASRPAEAVDLTRAVVVPLGDDDGMGRTASRMLIEEVGARSFVRWTSEPPREAGGVPEVVVGPADEVREYLEARGAQPPPEGRRDGPEGYAVGVGSGREGPVVWVAGDDDRGVLFGAGRLLRALRIDRERVALPADFAVESAPSTPLRGIQLGYRPKTNSYDGWTVAMWEQYIRDLVIFGCNAVELIPPRSDDAPDSPHFPEPPPRVMAEVSRLADSYGLDVWAWYPALDEDYGDPATVEAALEEWGAVFAALPRLDAIFVPGGDPGRTPPKLLFELLEKQAANLRRHHPDAGMWVSPQSFTAGRMDEFLDLIREEPEWLAGVVYGPEVRMDLPEFRAAIPSRYPIRDYPDVTHGRHCQYPVPDWDLAFSVTQGREVGNPRPAAMANIFRRNRPDTDGFIAYSEGCHDDVNKILWLALGWDDRADVDEILREYARHFVGPEFEGRFAEGLRSLERNWEGPALENSGIDETLETFRAMEREATPAIKRNWRFQQALYRAYFDAYVRERLRHETRLEAEARARLAEAEEIGSIAAMDEAEAILDRPAGPEVAALRSRLGELAEALFQSISMQLSVEKYGALAVERGANLDTADFPLNDAGWLKARFAEIRAPGDESDRLSRLSAALGRTDPGPGGFHDDLGDPANQPRLVRGVGAEGDPGFFASGLVGFGFRGGGPDPAMPRAWWRHAESLYDAPLLMRYEGLDPSASYRVRVVYARERRPTTMRLVADDGIEIHDFLDRAFEPLEFEVPRPATADGTLTLTWTQEPGIGGTGRGGQVAEVWLLRADPGDDR